MIFPNNRGLYERHEECCLCAHASNPTMHRTSAANTATFNSASIMLPSTESRLPHEVLIFRGPEAFPVIFHDEIREELGSFKAVKDQGHGTWATGGNSARRSNSSRRIW